MQKNIASLKHQLNHQMRCKKNHLFPQMQLFTPTNMREEVVLSFSLSATVEDTIETRARDKTKTVCVREVKT